MFSLRWQSHFAHFRENGCQLSSWSDHSLSIFFQVKMVFHENSGWFSLQLRLTRALSRNELSILVCSRTAFIFFTRNIKKDMYWGLGFKQMNTFESWIISAASMFLSETGNCVIVTATATTSSSWCHCLDSWEGANGFSHHCFCTIGANANTVKKATDIIVLLWK